MKYPGRGSTKRSTAGFPEHYADLRRIMVAFDEETFADIRARALSAQSSFAEQVRLLVEWGLRAHQAASEAAE